MAKLNYEAISVAQSNKEQSVNEAFFNANPALSFGIKRSLTAGLSFSLFGAKLSEQLVFNEQTLSLVANATNYIEADITTKTVLFNQTKFNNVENPSRIPLWKITTDASGIIESSISDERCNPIYSPSSSITEATDSALGLVKTSKTVAKNADGQLDVAVDGTTIVRDATTGVLSAPSSGGGSGGAGLTYLEEEKNTTLNALLLKPKASNTEANLGVGYVTKGTGQFIVTSLENPGNARGTNSIDLQSARTAVTQVASGFNSIAIGTNNTASNNESIAIGKGNTASYGVAIGHGNTNSNTYTMNFGRDNTASATYSLAVGYNNTSSGVSSTAIGFANVASARYAVASGYRNTADAEYANVIGNDASSKSIKYSFNRGNAFSASKKGSIQESLHLLYRNFSTADTENVLTSDGVFVASASTQITLLNNETKTFKATIKMQTANSPTAIAIWEVEGTIARYANAASTVFAFPVEFTKTQLNAQATAEAFNCSVTVDTTLGCLKISCSKNSTTFVNVAAKVTTFDLY